MQYFLDDLLLVKTIGKGNFGEVFLTQRKGTKELYATKKMERRVYEKPPLLNRLYNEVQILRMINHPNIVKFIDLKKTQNSYYLITEYINGDSLTSNLKKYMSHYGKPFPEDIVQYLMKQIVSALQYLHLNRIIHRDLKLDNILVNYPTEYDKQSLNLKKCQVKIIDFGFATVLNSNLTFTALGTPPNMDPKILEHLNTGIRNTGYNEKVDIWSLGTLCYEMVVGHSPFLATNIKELHQKVKKGNYTIPASLSEEIVSFIDEMLKQDPNERSNAGQLMDHKFLVNPVNTFHSVNFLSLKATYLPGGLLNMKSNQPNKKNNINITDDLNNWNIWSIFTEDKNPVTIPNQNPIQIQPQYQPQQQIQPQMQLPKSKPQYVYQQPQPQYEYKQPLTQNEYKRTKPQYGYKQTQPQYGYNQTQPQYGYQQAKPQQNFYYNQTQNNNDIYY